MRRGFSLYAPVVGIILASVALMIMAALVSEETARINYLKSLRASYAYLLPTQTIRYDAFTAFSVAARIWFQDSAIISPDSKPDIGEFVRSFITGFSSAGGGGIKGVEVNWNPNNWQQYASITEDFTQQFVKITVEPRGVGPTYILTLQSAGGKEENLVVPIFEGKTTIYIPYPYGKVQEIAKKIKNELQTYAQEGKLAYGYCAEGLKENRKPTSVCIFGNSVREGSMENLAETIKKQLGGDDWTVDRVTLTTGYEVSVNEVNKINAVYIRHDALKYFTPNPEKVCSGDVVSVVGEDEEYCHYITGIEVEGTVEVGGKKKEAYHFKLSVPLLGKGEKPHIVTKGWDRRENDKRDLLKFDCDESPLCKHKKESCMKGCLNQCSNQNYEECIQECENRCTETYSRCVNTCEQEKEKLEEKLKKKPEEVSWYCKDNIVNEILCDYPDWENCTFWAGKSS